MSYNCYDVNILVNGNRCKQYRHDGKTFIEAKNGSEYVLEIKNNTWKRALVVGAVDGLNVLTGKAATEQDNGYIIDAYSAEKIKGFRFSDDEWALFKFGFKFNGKTYAQDKGNGAEKNCGVIGIRLFDEYISPPVYRTTYVYNDDIQWLNAPITCGDNSSDLGYTAQYSSDNITKSSNPTRGVDYKSSVNYVSSKLSGAAMGRSSNERRVTCNSFSVQPKGFDMGTEWGRREKSKVTHVDFTRGILAHSLDIYYASRESLIEMGVPLTNELKVTLPQAFPDKYAAPPKNWNGY
jgi:hypothetical protein